MARRRQEEARRMGAWMTVILTLGTMAHGGECASDEGSTAYDSGEETLANLKARKGKN